MQLPATHDPWGEVLGDLEMTGVFYSTGAFTAPWGIEMPPLPGVLLFHLVLDGRAVVQVEGSRYDLGAGDLILVPHGSGHQILSDTGAPARSLWDIRRTVSQPRYEHLVIDGGGSRSTLACGAVSFTNPGCGRLLAGLPAALRGAGAGSGASEGPDAEWLRAAIDVIGRGARRPRPGSGVVAARLADVVLVQAVREWLESAEPASGWIAAFRDPLLGPVLQAIHATPERPWTLASLAGEARMSRSAFVERFTDTLAAAPMAYVTAWRLDLAARLLRDERTSVEAVARQVGYSSVPGFHRAFVRHHGLTPGAWRREGPPDPVAEAARMPR